MISTSNLSIQFGKRILFDEVNVTFKEVIVTVLLVRMGQENLLF